MVILLCGQERLDRPRCDKLNVSRLTVLPDDVDQRHELFDQHLDLGLVEIRDATRRSGRPVLPRSVNHFEPCRTAHLDIPGVLARRCGFRCHRLSHGLLL